MGGEAFQHIRMWSHCGLALKIILIITKKIGILQGGHCGVKLIITVWYLSFGLVWP